MKLSSIFPKTRREAPSNEGSLGTRLMIRAGFLDQIAAGVWIYPHLTLLVRKKAEAIVRRAMNEAGALELELPILQPRGLWEETERWDRYLSDKIAFHLHDRKNNEFILAPTAEEVITDFARRNIESFKDLPVNFYQMSPKFRDEFRPRQGLVRGREFVMKDAYSFDVDESGMKESYRKMCAAYHRVFTECGFNYIQVEADSGAIGGSGSAEFMAITETGEDVLLSCPSCKYGGNQEKATAKFEVATPEKIEDLVLIETPNIRTVAELETFTGLAAKQMVKTIVMVADGSPVIVSMRGDLEISEVKLANVMNAREVEAAPHDIVEKVTGAPVGFAGPIDLYKQTDVPYFFDRSVEGVSNFLCGGNKEDYHYINVNPGRDFPAIETFHDLSKVVAGQKCPHCNEGYFEEKQGIELGHVFQLQKSYAEKMNATYTGADGKDHTMWMGCYGIGVSRIVQTIVEQNNDTRGIIWPFILAPYHVCIIPANDTLMDEGFLLYEKLKSEGVEVIIDDRDARIGQKLTDAELQGWPITVVIGRDWEKNNEIEVRWRNTQNFPSGFNQKKEGDIPQKLMNVLTFITFYNAHKKNL